MLFFRSLLVMLLFFSCKEKITLSVKKTAIRQQSIAVKHGDIVPLKTRAKKEVANWEAYSNLQELIEKFVHISPNEGMSNALELKTLVLGLQTSILPKTLDSPAFQARMHVLSSEALRLADMTYITAIQATAINRQISKLLEVYNGINTKINTVVSQKQFEEIVHSSVRLIGVDTTKKMIPTKKSPARISPIKEEFLLLDDPLSNMPQ